MTSVIGLKAGCMKEPLKFKWRSCNRY